jgi:hypothetical protein
MAGSRQPYEPRIAGCDIGNATSSVNVPGIGSAFFPSFIAAVGVGRYDGISKIETSRHHITYAGKSAIIGIDATETGYDTLLAEYRDEAWRRYVEEYSFLCFLAGISAVFPTADAVGVKLGTGAPLSIYQAHGEAIRRRYLGEHQYSYNGHDRRVIVSDAIVFGEGRELLRLLPPAERRGRIIGHDIGGRTWNVMMWRDGALIGARTYDMGVDKLLGHIPSVSGDPLARWKMQQEIRAGGKAHARSQAELERLFADALKTIERKFPLAGADRHIIGGGGAFGLANVLRSTYRGAGVQVLNGDVPECANAAAYAAALSEA